MSIDIELKGVEEVAKNIESIPKDVQTILRRSVNQALKAAHTEALVQISRRYTINMTRVERDLREITAKGKSIVAQLTGRGRPIGAANFDVTPRPSTLNPAWTSKTGYNTQVLRGSVGRVSRDYFWIKFKNGGTHLARRQDPSARDKASNRDLIIFRTVSVPQMLGNEDVMDKVSEVTKQKLEEVFARGMERRL